MRTALQTSPKQEAVEVTVSNTLSQVVALVPEWDDLLARCPARNFFLTSTWNLAWLRAFGSGKIPYVLVFRNGSRLVGLMPLVNYRDKLRGIPVRTIGSPNDQHASRTDLIVEPGLERPVARALAAHLHAVDSGWDVVMLRQVPKEAPWLLPFIEACRGCGLVPFEPVPGVGKCRMSLQGTWNDYLASKTGHFRARLKEARNRVLKHGQLVYRRSQGTPQDFEIFAELEARSWKQEDGQARLGAPGWAFQRAAAVASGTGISCDNLFLELDGRVVGGIHAVGYAGTAYSMQMLFDESLRHLYAGRVQFGTHVADMFADERYEYLDLNGNSPFCKSWSDDELEFVGLQIYNRRPYSSLLSLLKRKIGRNR